MPLVWVNSCTRHTDFYRCTHIWKM